MYICTSKASKLSSKRGEQTISSATAAQHASLTAAIANFTVYEEQQLLAVQEAAEAQTRLQHAIGNSSQQRAAALGAMLASLSNVSAAAAERLSVALELSDRDLVSNISGSEAAIAAFKAQHLRISEMRALSRLWYSVFFGFTRAKVQILTLTHLPGACSQQASTRLLLV